MSSWIFIFIFLVSSFTFWLQQFRLISSFSNIRVVEFYLYSVFVEQKLCHHSLLSFSWSYDIFLYIFFYGVAGIYMFCKVIFKEIF